MTTQEKIQAAADRIWEAINASKSCEPIRDLLGETDLSSAYAAQRINTERKLNEGHRIIGCKIGLTSFAVQKQLGVDQPDFGILTDRMVVAQGEPIAWNELMQPKAEAEIAFIMGGDLSGEKISMGELEKAIESAVASIEVVGSRIEGWNIRITDTIADNASASHFVLGNKRAKLGEIDLENCRMSMTRAGEVVSTGEGRACMGNPMNAALWLAQTMNDLGSPLRAGDIVLAGALGPMVAVNPGDQFTASIEGLGEVGVSFGTQS
jgi:2-keto-4-pentenoate hydratase